MELLVIPLAPDVKLPTRATPQSAGLDIYAPEDIVIGYGKTLMISTKLKMKIPEGYVGRILGKSSLEAPPNCLHVLAGVIDADYTGEWKIVFKNLGRADVEIKKYQKMAQLVVYPVVYPEVVQVEADEFPTTDRGDGGFGSTGKF